MNFVIPTKHLVIERASTYKYFTKKSYVAGLLNIFLNKENVVL